MTVASMIDQLYNYIFKNRIAYTNTCISCKKRFVLASNFKLVNFGLVSLLTNPMVRCIQFLIFAPSGKYNYQYNTIDINFHGSLCRTLSCAMHGKCISSCDKLIACSSTLFALCNTNPRLPCS